MTGRGGGKKEVMKVRTKDEILKDVQAFCEYLPDKAWYVEYAKLEVLLDIRDLIDDLAVAINEIDKTLCIVKK